MVPASIRRSCVNVPITQFEAIAALRCEAGQVDRVEYVLYADQAGLDSAWGRRLTVSGLDGSGDCETGQPHAGSWGTDGFFGIGGETLGKLACWYDDSGNARLDWTLDSALVRQAIRRADGDLSGLYRTWTQDGLTVRTRGG
jgi:serine/threonine-protein kinase